MSIPTTAVAVPDRVRELAGGDRLEPVWRNGLGGLTFRATGARGIRYLKWGPRNPESSAEGEAARLEWARVHAVVPPVLDAGGDDVEEWLVTEALPGESAVAPRWIADPRTAVVAIGEGLRTLHERLPRDSCPFSWQVPDRIENAERRGIRLPDELRGAPPIDRLLVCHGDACSPNTLLDDDGRFVGHVDLTALGVADRWADLATAALSAEWNYGPGWTSTLLDAYGITADEERLSYYRELWNAT